MFLSQASNPREFRRRKGQRSIALVATLALLAVLSLLIVAFVTTMRLDRSATASYSQSLKAEQIASGGLQLVVSQLQQEMAKDAAANVTYPTKPLFVNVMLVDDVVGNLLITNISPQGVGTNSAMVDLVKISTNAAFFTGTRTTGKLKATTINSSVPSVNGRMVSPARWNQAFMGTFPSAATTPYWILMSRGGPTNAASIPFGATTANSVNNPVTGNTNYVIGRMAYAVYNEGDLLNITVAGYPNAATANATAKGSPIWADLSQIPGVVNADALVQWRNATTSTNYLTYATYFSATNGYGKVYPGDTTFLSRSDLIHYAQANPAVITTNSLPYLTTFSWEANTPSWMPIKTPNGTTSYVDLAMTVSSTNVFLPLVRVPIGGWTRRDGSIAVKGEPLVTRRFPLSKISLITPSAIAVAGSGSDIEKYFGLTRSTASSPWVYRSGATSIKSLNAVASLTGAQAREPDFFELLQACILTGSVGQFLTSKSTGLAVNTDTYSSTAYVPTTDSTLPGPDQWKMRQIMQIGVNIIDQATTDNYPTIVSYVTGTNADQVAGTKDLPYPHTFLTKVVAFNPGLVSSSTFPAGYPTNPTWLSTNITPEIAFSMWNPHQLNPGTTNLPGPTNFQVTVNTPAAGASAQYSFAPSGTAQPAYPNGPATYGNIGTISGSSIPFTVPNTNDANADYRSGPRVIRQDGTQSAAAILDFPINPSKPSLPKAIGYKMTAPGVYLGTYGGINYALTNTVANVTPTDFGYNHSYLGVVFSFQYKDATGTWQTYATMSGPTNNPGSYGIHNSNNKFQMQSPQPAHSSDLHQYWPYTLPDNTDGIAYLKSDPRTYRFGISYIPGYNDANGFAATNYPKGDYPLIPTSSPTTDQYIYTLQQNPGGVGGFCRIDLFSQNTADLSTSTYTYKQYSDPDGEVRYGDCYLSPTNQPMSLIPSQVANRPIILSRSFRSVGELGYTFRDAPWKSIDFSSANSADGGLLDAFTVVDAPLVAGKVDLNTKHPEVLAALLAGGSQQEVMQTTLPQITGVGLSPTLDTNTASTLASALVQNITTTPIYNVSDLPRRIPTVNSKLPNPFVGKMQVEAITRALADSTSTRSWNLMIDMVAQSGKYPPNATALDQFVVEGERHYWMHVSIDRFTGQIIAKKVEVPNE